MGTRDLRLVQQEVKSVYLVINGLIILDKKFSEIERLSICASKCERFEQPEVLVLRLN